MKSRAILITAILLSGLVLYGQPAETTYEGTLIASGYQQSLLPASDGPFPIGFNFTFFGNTYTEFYVSANGLVTFTDPDGLFNTEVTIPTATTPNNYIAPFWDNLSIVDGGNILYRTFGASTNRKCVIQFKNMGFDPIPTPLGTFTVILYENTNVIQAQYRLIVDPYTPASHGGSATIGLENAAGSAGVLYAFQNATAVYSEDVISFTPSGSTYTVNDNALYDGVFLTTNEAVPDPGIVNLISPPSDAVVGVDPTLSWGAATGATSYTLLIDTDPTLATASYYNAGLNQSYIKTGLIPGTYYWAVFSTNATATTWCEIRRFSVSTTPPLAPVSLTIWTELGQDKTIKLDYTGGDVSPKTAKITSLPAQGQLYQYNAGVRGLLISTVPTALTDPDRNVIYAASGTSGNGVGNFNFKINDVNGDSPEGTVTVNVSNVPIPHVLYIAKNANVEIQLDQIMVDPAGKQNQFEIKVNGTPVTISSASLKSGDPYTIVLTLTNPLAGSETVLVSYTQGDVTSAAGGVLLSFDEQSVTLTAQTITWTQDLARKYNESPLTLTATPTTGLTYTSSNTSVATVSGTSLIFNSLGTSDITARLAGNTTLAPVKYIKTLTVSKGDQTITFAELPGKIVGDEDFNLVATATSGLTVTFSSSKPEIATVTGIKVHIVGAGTTVITASQAGNALWNAAPDVPRDLGVSSGTGFEDPVTSENSFNIYITYGQINIQTLSDDWNGRTGSVNIIDISGKPVRMIENVQFSKNSPVQVQSRFSNGLYVVEIKSGLKRFVGKILIR